MWFSALVTYFFLALQAVLAAPPAEYSRVLIVVDEKDADVDASVLADPLQQRGFEVITSGLKDHPKLVEYGIRSTDNVIIVPGKTKALGSSLKSPDLLEFMKLGGNIVALTTSKHSPAALREIAAQLGIEVSGRGIEGRNHFKHDVHFPHLPIYSGVESLSASELINGAAVAKLDPTNSLSFGLVQAPYSAYAFNAAKESDGSGEDDELVRPVSDAFAVGSDFFIGAALQSLHGSRFVWVGSPELLKITESAALLTSWAFQERGKLRVANTTHKSLRSGESHLHYMVDEPLQYCAQIEQWSPELQGWVPFEQITDVQLEFKMLDPYYRLPLGSDGCVEFVAPDQYGMFTFQIDYKRPGLTFLDERNVVTVRHRANDEWDRSWTISNSWVYLSGVSTTAIGFLIFVALYLALPQPAAAAPAPASAASTAGDEKKAVRESIKKADEEPKSTPQKSRRKTKH